MALDLYAIEDGEPTPEDPDGLRHVSQLDLPEHHALRHVWATLGADDPLPYFHDTRMSSAEVASLRDLLLANTDVAAGPNEAVLALIGGLERAITLGCGIVAYAD